MFWNMGSVPERSFQNPSFILKILTFVFLKPVICDTNFPVLHYDFVSFVCSPNHVMTINQLSYTSHLNNVICFPSTLTKDYFIFGGVKSEESNLKQYSNKYMNLTNSNENVLCSSVIYIHRVPIVAIWRFWTLSTLVQFMACCLFSTKPSPEPLMRYCQFDSRQQSQCPVIFESKYNNTPSRKCILKCRLQNVSHFIPASMY